MGTRSSLELMLDSIRELEARPKDTPPPLPVRPVSRARLPRARRPLQFHPQTKRPAHFDHFQNEIKVLESTQEKTEKGISNIQKWFRGNKVRQNYKELRTRAIALQSFVRGEVARRNYLYRSKKRLRAIVLIQTHMRKYFKLRMLEHNPELVHLQSGIEGNFSEFTNGDTIKPRLVANVNGYIQVRGTVLLDLREHIMSMEAKVREKKEENVVLKARIEEMERKWARYEERMKSMEKTWQDELRHIQNCLAAANGVQSGRILDLPITSVHDRDDLVPYEGSNVGELGLEPIGEKGYPYKELYNLKLRFKAWKKDYRNKLKEARNGRKSWWGRVSQ